jgi:hypothetical protein
MRGFLWTAGAVLCLGAGLAICKNQAPWIEWAGGLVAVLSGIGAVRVMQGSARAKAAAAQLQDLHARGKSLPILAAGTYARSFN